MIKNSPAKPQRNRAAVLLERAWRVVESRHSSAASAMVADSIEVASGGLSLLVGVDSGGSRHLLVPIEAETEVTSSLSGRWVRLSKRQLIKDNVTLTFADLGCYQPDLYDEFAILAGEVLEAVECRPTNALGALNAVLSRWRELLRTVADDRLDRSRVIGLFTELCVLEQVLSKDPERRIDCWTGPAGGRHDFQRGLSVVEVKGSTARRGRPMVIHGLDQLDEPPNANLFLWWWRLEVGVERGESLQEIVDRLRVSVPDPEGLESRLRAAGYENEVGDDTYGRPRFTVLETRLYRVDGLFPRLIGASFVGGDVPRGVTAVTYEIDLSGDDPAPLPEERQGFLVSQLAGQE